MKNWIKKSLVNSKGTSIRRKIVVFESDDWGTIRVSNKAAQTALKNYGISIEKCNYMMNDALASEDDMQALFNLLSDFKNYKGNPPIFTANTIVANPDFQKIKESNFEKYYFESFLTTQQNYPKHQGVFELWKQGQKDGLFQPQFHGREHLNIARWMNDLKNNDNETRFAFDLGIFGVSAHVSTSKRGSYLAAFDGYSDKSEIATEGLKLFKQIFKFESKSMIAPNYIWDDNIENEVHAQGVKYIQGTHVQRLPREKGDKQQIVRHSLGQRNSNKQIYLVRNVLFEPSENQDRDWVNQAMTEIQNAFFWNKPAIISTHRVNYVGFLNEKNRDQSLNKLKLLISSILKKWPEVEFLSSDQLGNILAQKYE